MERASRSIAIGTTRAEVEEAGTRGPAEAVRSQIYIQRDYLYRDFYWRRRHQYGEGKEQHFPMESDLNRMYGHELKALNTPSVGLEDVAKLEEALPGLYEALVSIPSTAYTGGVGARQ